MQVINPATIAPATTPQPPALQDVIDNGFASMLSQEVGSADSSASQVALAPSGEASTGHALPLFEEAQFRGFRVGGRGSGQSCLRLPVVVRERTAAQPAMADPAASGESTGSLAIAAAMSVGDKTAAAALPLGQFGDGNEAQPSAYRDEDDARPACPTSSRAPEPLPAAPVAAAATCPDAAASPGVAAIGSQQAAIVAARARAADASGSAPRPADRMADQGSVATPEAPPGATIGGRELVVETPAASGDRKPATEGERATWAPHAAPSPQLVAGQSSPVGQQGQLSSPAVKGDFSAFASWSDAPAEPMHPAALVGATYHPASTPESGARSIAEAVISGVDRGVREVVVRMDPPELGRVDVRVIDGPNGLEASFSADGPRALEMLTRDLGELRILLAESGVRVETVRIETRAEAAAWRLPANGGDRGGSWNSHGEGRGDRRPNPDEAPAPEPVSSFAVRQIDLLA